MPREPQVKTAHRHGARGFAGQLLPAGTGDGSAAPAPRAPETRSSRRPHHRSWLPGALLLAVMSCSGDGKALPDGSALPDAEAPSDGMALPDGMAPPDGNAPPATTVLTPRIVEPFWRIASSPDLGPYDNRPKQQPVDFAIWQAADGTWQLWSCIRFTNVGGNTRLFYRWEGKALTDSDWEPKGIAMMADPAVGEIAGGLQAPHVTRVGDTWHMFYGDWEHICHATSTDGKTFTRVIEPDGTTSVFSEGAGKNTRDPMLFVAPGEYRLYYTSSAGIDFVRTSSDLMTFGPARAVAGGGSAGMGCCTAECPFVVRPQGGDYFLFRTQRYGTDAQTSVYRSTDPFDFGLVDDSHLVGRLPIAAPELVELEGQWYVATVRGDLQGIQIARLAWSQD